MISKESGREMPRSFATASTSWWRLGLVVVSYAFYLAMFLIPWAWLRGQLLLDLDNPSTILFGVGAGLIGAGLVELVWWLTAKHRGEPARIWRGSDEG